MIEKSNDFERNWTFSNSYCQLEIKDKDPALKDMKKFMKKYPKHIPSILARNHCQLQIGKTDDALKDMNKFMKRYPLHFQGKDNFN